MKRKNKSLHLVLLLSIIVVCISNISIKDFPKYYKSLVYVSAFNAIYYLLCRRHLVWEFVPSGINWWVIRLLHTLIITPIITLMFLSNIPSDLYKQFLYLIRWVFIASIVEFAAHKKNLILYAHGWNIFWSSLLYLMMFAFSYLFTLRPILTLFLSVISTIFYQLKFRVPLKIKHYSRYFEVFVDLYYHTYLEDLLNIRRRKIL